MIKFVTTKTFQTGTKNLLFLSVTKFHSINLCYFLIMVTIFTTYSITLYLLVKNSEVIALKKLVFSISIYLKTVSYTLKRALKIENMKNKITVKKKEKNTFYSDDQVH